MLHAERGRVDGVALSFLAGCVFCWGTSYRAVDIGLERTGPVMLTALRTAPAAPVLLLLLPFLRSRLPRGRTLFWAAVTGPLMVALFNFGISEAVERAGAGLAAVLVNTVPFFVLVLGWMFLRERIPRAALAGLVVGFAGVVMVVSSQLSVGHRAASVAVGIVLALGGALGWAVATLIVKRLAAEEPALDFVGFTAVQYVSGGGALVVLAFATEGSGGTQWGSGWLWGVVAYVVLGSSAFGSIAFFQALRRLSATQASAAGFLVPVVAVVVEIARGRTPGAVVLTGMVLTIAGVAIVNAPRERLAPAR
jgi:O-acetylserine/cysteine efflux transporter